MTALETALTAWIAFHGELGVDMQQFLHAPATDLQIRQVEEAIGYELPEDLRELYTLANGQIGFDELWDKGAGAAQYNGAYAPLFGRFDFLPLDKALYEYNFWLDMYESDRDFRKKYNKANPDRPSHATEWEVRDGDPVDSAGWNPMWFPFAKFNADYYFVDLQPPRGGMPGQVVLHGADEYILQVPASSVTEFMQQAAVRLDSGSPDRFEREDATDAFALPSVFFDMDWRRESHNTEAQAAEPHMPAYEHWQQQQDDARDRRMDDYRMWLGSQQLVQAISSRDIDEIMQWTGIMLHTGGYQVPPASVLAEIKNYMLSVGETISGLFADGEAPGKVSDRDPDALAFQQHLTMLAPQVLRSGIDNLMPLPVTARQAFDLYHAFLHESGEWSARQKLKAGEFIDEIEAIALEQQSGSDPVSGYSMNMTSNENSLEICFPVFDSDTYKSGEECVSVDLTKYLD